VRDFASGKEIAVLKGHQGWVRRIHLTPDGKSIISCGFDSTIRFWNRESFKVERRITTSHEGIGPSALSPDGKWLITASRTMGKPDPGIITVWDVATGKIKTAINGPTRKVGSLAVSPDGRFLGRGGGFIDKMGEVKVFDLATGNELAAFHDHKACVEGMAMTPDGRWLVSGSGYSTSAGEVRMWDLKSLRRKGE